MKEETDRGKIDRERTDWVAEIHVNLLRILVALFFPIVLLAIEVAKKKLD